MMIHSLFVSVLESLDELEKQNFYHGFLNTQNICIRPADLPDESNVESYVHQILDDYIITICDCEA